MNRPKDMEDDLFKLLGSFLMKQHDDTPFRLSAQRDALKELVCERPEIRRWLRDWDFPFLMETLMLDDSVFRREFPGAQSTAEDRKELLNALELHCETCDYCGRKRAYDLEWQLRVRGAFAENKQSIERAIAHAAAKK